MQDLHSSYFFDLSKFAYPHLFADCRYVWDALKNLSNFFKNFSNFQILTEIPHGAYIVNPESVFIGRGTIVEPGAYIRGPCIIGQNCTVRHGAYIRGDFICGDRCVIGHDTEIKSAIFLDDVHAAHFAYVGDTILGNHVNLGAGTKLANLRFDGKEITIRDGDQLIESHRRKFGAIMGDHAQTGCNSVLLPGACVGRNVMINAGIVIGGIIPSGSYVLSPQKPLIRNPQ